MSYGVKLAGPRDERSNLTHGMSRLFYRGVWDGLSNEEARQMYPDEWERFLADPYAHRAPRAESYHDLSGEFKIMQKLSVWYG